MYSIGKRNKKGIAAFFLFLSMVQNFFPVAAYALTSGPAQPEMQQFQPAGAGNMVDLFSGDFKYDIPLMDVGGYPVNLSYHSGNGVEDEAGWVGMGWSLNPGAVNRNMRGIPDDFMGNAAPGDPADIIRTVQYKKDFKKIGAQLVLKPTAFAWEFGKASLHLGVYKDNYYGIGGELGAGLSFTLDENEATDLTAGLQLNSDSREGVTVSPSLSLTSYCDEAKELNQGALTGGFSYNTRSGLEEMSLGLSFGLNGTSYDDWGWITNEGGASFGLASLNKYFIHSYTPTFGTNTSSSKSTFSFDLGPTLFGGYVGVGGSGYLYSQKNTELQSSLPAFGYLNYAAGRHNTNAILDFNREKDGPYIENAPAIPIPVSTEDYFMVTSQAGSAQFRPYYNGEYTIFDRSYSNSSSDFGAGITIGAGNAFQGGAHVDITNTSAYTRRWDNVYTTAADPNPPAPLGAGSDLPEGIYFKKVGEQTMADHSYFDELYGTNTQKVSLTGSASSGASIGQTLINSSGQPMTVGPMQRTKRDIRTTSFSYMTAGLAARYGLDKNINGDPNISRVDLLPTDLSAQVTMVHKPHHISEVTVTDEEGKRMVYGVPVYNTDQEEVSFSVTQPANPGDPTDQGPFNAARKTGLVPYTDGNENSTNNRVGRGNYYNRKSIPPYATSYLLSGILSPDYVDRTGNGISDDDLGTAVKFRYRRSSTGYKWRAPYESRMAGYNEGFLSDPKDDKGNYVYGTKELWYLDTIESKTMIAVFWKSPRKDGYGVTGEGGGIGDASQQVQKLDSIQLFSKADLIKNMGNAIPIKVAHFEYDYSLYPGVTNNVGGDPLNGPDPLAPVGSSTQVDLNAAKGKLTLRKVYFTFGASARGQTNPYVFSYDMRLINTSGAPAQQDPKEVQDLYMPRATDRWGVYKQPFYNGSGGGVLNNSEFPYTLQPTTYETYDTRQLSDRLASKWQLNSITTPSGGIISIEYEADDYAYVQDRKAMIMCPLVGVGKAGSAMGTSGMINAGLLYVKVPIAAADKSSFINTYLGGPNGRNWSNISFKVLTDMDGHGHQEYVYGYAEIDYSLDFPGAGTNVVGIPVKMVNTYNPVSKVAWQDIQTDLPQYAYENYDNSDVSSFGDDAAAAVRSIVQAFLNLRELGQSFDQTASGKKYADTFDPQKSFIRLDCPIGQANGKSDNPKHTYGKVGGGSRVRKVEISDVWLKMTGGSTDKTLSNGILYEYTTKGDNGLPVSSGVAAYEPGIGNEENPFHEPVPYTEKVQWGEDKYHFIERPWGESYFPGPEVGYSEVKATSYGYSTDNSGNTTAPITNTGYTISRFYTARDFPTQVDFTPLDARAYENDLTLLLFASKYTKRVETSQGFKVVLNDMHGKPKSTGIYDNGDKLLSSAEYYYNVKDDHAQQQQLNNIVPTMAADGKIAGAGNLIATDEELVTDIRESSSSSTGTSIGTYGGFFYAFFPIPFAAINYSGTASLRTYNSISTVKVIHQYGLLKETRTTQNGSTLTADNLLWDGQTGQVLLTRTQNEFDQYTYALHYPAYRAYDGMGGAYQNVGALFSGLGATGGALLTGMKAYLSPGDELVDVDPGTNIKGWVIPTPDGTTCNLIDATGNFITTPGNYKLLRSGRRNMLDASAGTVVTMTNPLILAGNIYTLQAGVDKRVLDARAETYKDEWDMPVARYPTTQTPVVTDAYYPGTSTSFGAGHQLPRIYSNFDIFSCGLFAVNSANGRKYLYSFPEDNVSLATLINAGGANGSYPSEVISSALSNFFATCTGTDAPPDINQVYYYLVHKQTDVHMPGAYQVGNGDIAYIAAGTRIYAIITFNTINNTSLEPTVSVTPVLCNDAQSACDGQGNGSSTNSYYLAPCTSQPAPAITMTWASVPYTYTTGSTATTCNDPLNRVINPYYLDIKGNWRVDYDHVYQVGRVQAPGVPGQVGGTNIMNSGYYSSYTPFWTQAGLQLFPLPEVPGPVQHTLADPRWEWTSKQIHFDSKGNAVENVDPLNRYSAALYGYEQSMATAVATNARHNEIAFDGFEDYYFQLAIPGGSTDPCPLGRHLEMGFSSSGPGGQISSGSNSIVQSPVHSGNYSVQLGTLNITQPTGSASPAASVLGFDAPGHYVLLSNEQAAGFAPVPNKPYLVSLWVYDNNANSNKIIGLTASINGQPVNFDFANKTVPVVEGWKKLEFTFTLPVGTSTFTLTLNGPGLNIDDLRIQPFDAQMKTFVYDDQSMRLTGQLDENNFGIFYEYDEEGTPIRVKKETERGMMTVKENRQSYKKYTQP